MQNRKIKRSSLVALTVLIMLLLTLTLVQAGNNSITIPISPFAHTTSLALDAAGNPVVAFSNGGPEGGDLFVMHCNDPNCDPNVPDDPDTAANEGEEHISRTLFWDGAPIFPKLALDSAGHPVVIFTFGLSEYLTVMHCNDPNCAGDDESITYTTGTDNMFIDGRISDTSLALDADGNPVVSFSSTIYDFEGVADGRIKIMHCNDPNCAGDDESFTSPDSYTGNVSVYTSLVLDADGNPVVSYYDGVDGNLKLMHCNDPNCAGYDESITFPDVYGNGVGKYSSLRLDADGNPVISYYDEINAVLKVLHCNDPNCDPNVPDDPTTQENEGEESVTFPDFAWAGTGKYSSMRLDSQGYPVISYYDEVNFDLKVMRCNDPNCDPNVPDNPNTEENEGEESVVSPDIVWDGSGRLSSLALDADDLPVVSYIDHIRGDLKILHCGRKTCSDVNEKPVADAGGPYVGTIGVPLTLDASGSYDDGSIVLYEWDLVDIPGGFDLSSESPTVTYTFDNSFLNRLRTLRVTDDEGEVAEVTFFITIEGEDAPTPQEATENLIEDVEDLVDSGALENGNGLIAKLENVIASLENGNTNAACNQHNAFINEVNAFINSGQLMGGDGQELINSANNIRTDIGC